MGLLKALEEKKKAKLRAERAKKAKATAIGAVTGAVAGIVGGLLFAPKSGKETREQIAVTSKKATAQVKESVVNVKDRVKTSAAAGKENIVEAKSRIQQYLADKKSAKEGTSVVEAAEEVPVVEAQIDENESVKQV